LSCRGFPYTNMLMATLIIFVRIAWFSNLVVVCSITHPEH
jgi:hypothetical protein